MDSIIVEEKITKNIIDDMISSGNVELEKLYEWCKITRNINKYGQIKLKGLYRNPVFERCIVENSLFTLYIMRILLSTDGFNGIIKNNDNAISTYSELWDLIGCTSKATQNKLKKFINEYSIIRKLKKYNKSKCKNVTKLILNPFLLRNSNYIAQETVILFKDFIIENENIEEYSFKWLKYGLFI